MGKYDKIIDLPHHQSKNHPQMPLYDRAAQFAPFAALTGYDDLVEETARVTDEKIELGESEKLEDLQLEGLKIIQDKKGFCFGIDIL